MTKKKKNNSLTGSTPPKRLRWSAWAVLAGAWLLLVASLASYDPGDWPGHAAAPYNEPLQNWVGIVGAWLAHKLYLMIGPGVWMIVAGFAAYLVTTAVGRRGNQTLLRLIGLLFMGLATSAIVGLGMPESFVAALPGGWNSQWPSVEGGLLAVYINNELGLRFGWLGTMVILTVVFWVGAILTADRLVIAVPWLIGSTVMLLTRIGAPVSKLGQLLWVPSVSAARWSGRWALATSRAAVPTIGDISSSWRRDDEKPVKRSTQRRGRSHDARSDSDTIDEDAGGLGGTESFDPDKNRRKRRKLRLVGADDIDDDTPVVAEVDDAEDEDLEDDDVYEDEVDEVVEDAEEEEIEEDEATADAPGAYLESRRAFTPDELRAKIKKLPINFAPKLKSASAMTREVDLSGYEFPSLSLLEEPEGDFTEEMERIVRDQALQLESALKQYRIKGEVVGIDSGPVITLFEVRLAPGTKVASINSISSDLARSLRAQNIRVVPNMAGKDTVGIEVPNLKKERVRLKELMTANPDSVHKMGLPMFLGKNASGQPLNADLASMPHMLIAGTTGSGKSVCMNSIIMSFLFTKRPDELKLVLVDPKMVEMSMFRDIPHLMCPVVTEMGRASAILEWATTKMDERYELLAEAGVRDIAGYNSLSWEDLKDRMAPATEAEEARIPKKLPYLVFVIDELADLMMTNKEVEGFIVRLAQKSRAVGMHLILATQRPQANVVTGLIKSNMPCRVSFKVASSMDSRIVLDQKGAELLLGQGDMLFVHPRTSKLTRAQGTLVDDHEIRDTVKFLKTVAQQNFEPQLVQIKSAGMANGDEERDPLFNDAVEVVLQTKRGSVSLLQRRLTIGYGRASRLIEQMAEAGIIGEYKGSQAREVNITPDEWEAIKAQAAADAEVGMIGMGEMADESLEDNSEDDDIRFKASDEFDDDADIDASMEDEREE